MIFRPVTGSWPPACEDGMSTRTGRPEYPAGSAGTPPLVESGHAPRSPPPPSCSQRHHRRNGPRRESAPARGRRPAGQGDGHGPDDTGERADHQRRPPPPRHPGTVARLRQERHGPLPRGGSRGPLPTPALLPRGVRLHETSVARTVMSRTWTCFRVARGKTAADSIPCVSEPLPTELMSRLASSLVRVRATEESSARADQARPSRDQGPQASGAAAHASARKEQSHPRGKRQQEGKRRTRLASS